MDPFERKSPRASAVFAGRLRFVGLKSLTFHSKLRNKVIVFKLHYFVFLFLAVCNVLHVPLISVPVSFRGAVRAYIIMWRYFAEA